MGLEIIILTEVSQTTERKVAYDIAYMWNVRKEKKSINKHLQNGSRVKDIENKLEVIQSEIS